MKLREQIRRWLSSDDYIEGIGWPTFEPRQDEFGRHLNNRRRTLRRWCDDVWRAATGRSICSMRITIHPTKETVQGYVEVHHEFLFPMMEGLPASADLANIGGPSRHFYPSVRQSFERRRTEGA